jgi:hypothetical protein
MHDPNEPLPDATPNPADAPSTPTATMSNPYAPPRAPVHDQDRDDEEHVPATMLRAMRLGTNAALFAAGLAVIQGVYSWAHFRDEVAMVGVVSVANVVIVSALAYGIARRSRVCAIALAAYIALEMVLSMAFDGGPQVGHVVFVAIILCLAHGSTALVRYHKLLRELGRV